MKTMKDILVITLSTLILWWLQASGPYAKFPIWISGILSVISVVPIALFIRYLKKKGIV